jgi:hypothetical protein
VTSEVFEKAKTTEVGCTEASWQDGFGAEVDASAATWSDGEMQSVWPTSAANELNCVAERV